MLARIGIGSNVGDAARNVRDAFEHLAQTGTVTARSSLYRTKAWGVTEQADFFNAAVLLETPLDPYALLRELKRIEVEMGRVATYRWGPRVIDLDILSYDAVTIDDPGLTIPHPRLHERAFALAPLAEIDSTFASLLEQLSAEDRSAVQRLSD